MKTILMALATLVFAVTMISCGNTTKPEPSMSIIQVQSLDDSEVLDVHISKEMLEYVIEGDTIMFFKYKYGHKTVYTTNPNVYQDINGNGETLEGIVL